MTAPSVDPQSPLQRLYRAIGENDLSTVEQLLQTGIDPRTPVPCPTGDARSFDLLETAIYAGRTEAAALLLNHGAEPNLRPKRELAPLTIAAMLGNTPIVRLLLQHGADPNHGDPEGGGTALMAAVDDGYLEVVELLLAAGADPKFRDDEGETALSIAQSKAGRRKRITHRLLAAGALE